ncbi:hypothetical protein ABDZ15_01020 [Mycobacterium canetti]|uniref:hypothetical protein n=1 Tax=Mycobacterium canetti TaxID=78331 RepID=UPI0032E51FE3
MTPRTDEGAAAPSLMPDVTMPVQRDDARGALGVGPALLVVSVSSSLVRARSCRCTAD